jgi:hypothetical protein
MAAAVSNVEESLRKMEDFLARPTAALRSVRLSAFGVTGKARARGKITPVHGSGRDSLGPRGSLKKWLAPA